MQIHPAVLEVLTQERERDLARRRRSARARRESRFTATRAKPASIRLAQPSDSGAVGRLASLDAGTAEGMRIATTVESGERPGVLLAETAGALVAALDLGDGGARAYGDPFRRSEEAVRQLRARARQYGVERRSRARRMLATLSRPQPRRA
jgi:hypothetical protein